MTREEFKRKNSLNVYAFMVAAVVPTLVCLPLMLALLKFVQEINYENADDMVRNVIAAGVGFIVIAALATIFALRFVARRFPLPQPLCPACAKAWGAYTYVSGLCLHCGERIFDVLELPGLSETFEPLESEVLAARQRTANREMPRALKIIGACAVLAIFFQNMADFIHAQGDQFYAAVYGAIVGASCVAGIVFLVKFSSRCKVVCPCCKKEVHPQMCWHLMATGICPQCGRTILLPRKNAEGAALTLGEWEACLKKEKRLSLLDCLYAYIMFAPFIAPFYARISEMGIPGRAALSVVAVMLFGAGLAWPRKKNCACPQCGEPIHFMQKQILFTTGNCPHCGGRIIKSQNP